MPDFVKSQLHRELNNDVTNEQCSTVSPLKFLKHKFRPPSCFTEAQSRTKRLTKKQRRFVPDPSEENGIKSSGQRDPSPPWSSYLCSRLENLKFQTHRKRERVWVERRRRMQLWDTVRCGPTPWIQLKKFHAAGVLDRGPRIKEAFESLGQRLSVSLSGLVISVRPPPRGPARETRI